MFKKKKNTVENPIRIGVVGTGLIGVSHIKAINNIPGFKLSCLCDLNEKVVSELAWENNVPYFLDYKEIPSKVELDAVILNLPHFLHCEASVFFLDSGINVFIEKPMANTVAECDLMLEAEKRSGKKLAVGHIQRYYESNRKVRELVKSGKLGKFCMSTEARSTFYFASWRPRWFLDKEKAGGGIVMNFGAHALDKHFYITGERTVSAVSKYDNYLNDFNVEGHAQFMAKFESGSSMSVTLSAYSPVIYDDVYYFTKGSVRCVDNGNLEIKVMGEKKPTLIKIKDKGMALQRELEDFYNLLVGKESEITDGVYGKAVVESVEAIFSNQM